jgi:predicted hydrolase (HD superfamily)
MAVVAAEDKLTWGLAGLLHDIDLAETSADPMKHGLIGARVLAGLQFPDPVVPAVKSHDDRSGVPRSGRLDTALFCADQGYWLVMATDPRASSGPQTADAQVVWEQVRSLPAKQDVLKKLSAECPRAGFSPQKVIELSLKGMRNTQ